MDSGRDSLLRGLDENFLKDMQNLHDEEINWSGPSFEGEDEAEEIAKDMA